MPAPARSFDPSSPGARRLARTWLSHRERWRVRWLSGRFRNPDGSVVEAGQTMEVAAPQGRKLVHEGAAELIDRRIASAHE
jgi:hypothetical protein